jgi:hypothetical protein
MQAPPVGEVIAELVEVGDDEHLRKTFTLSRDTQVTVYALGEGDSGDMYDFGWIEDRRSGRTVWKMRYDRSEHAGGGRKNRRILEQIVLPAGEYILHYETDDSHSFEDWNVTPPEDPARYGITLYRSDR